MEKEIEINLKNLHIILRDDCAHFIYDYRRKYQKGSLFLESLNLDKSSTCMIALFIDKFLRFSSVFCNINLLNETDFGKVHGFGLVTATDVTYKINVESLVFTHKCSKYIDEYNDMTFQDKLSILQSGVIQLCSDILLDEKRIIHITKPEDIDKLKTGQWIRFTCKQCGKEVKAAYSDPKRHKYRYKQMLCRNCETKKTCLEKYGAEHPSQAPVIQEKIKQTCLEKYGVVNPGSSPMIQEKIKQVWLEKYGCDHISKSPMIQEKIKRTCLEKYGVEYVLQSPAIQEKRKQTCLKLLGVENPSQSFTVKEKKKQTCFKHYGVEHPTQSPEVMKKVQQTNVSHRGCEYPTQSPEVMKKVRRSMLEHFGCRHPSQSPKLQKIMHKRYDYFGTTFDSSWELYYFIYQTKILLTNCVRNYGEIYFEYIVNDKVHRYIPDFITNGKIVEIKGTHLFDDNSLIDVYGTTPDEILKAKMRCMFDNVDEIITRKEITPMIKEVKRLFGVHYIDQFKVNKDEEGLKAS